MRTRTPEDENADTGSTDAGSIHVVEDAGTDSLEDKEDTGTDSLTVGEDLIPFGQTLDGSSVEYGEHIVDALVRQEVDLTVIFVPEHGLRGKDDAGARRPACLPSRSSEADPHIPLPGTWIVLTHW